MQSLIAAKDYTFYILTYLLSLCFICYGNYSTNKYLFSISFKEIIIHRKVSDLSVIIIITLNQNNRYIRCLTTCIEDYTNPTQPNIKLSEISN